MIQVMEMRNDLKRLYESACECINWGDGADMEVIGLGAEIYVKYMEALPEEISNVLCKCVPYINHDVEDCKTIKDFIADGEDLIEDISGILGEFFSD